jgi:Ca2+-binding RTX toxin-like protein
MKKRNPNYLVIDGTPGDDMLVGTADPDTIHGIEGNDTLIGGDGSDDLFGGPGNDDYRVETMGDEVFENVGEGIDRVYTLGSYTLAPGQEIEMLVILDPINPIDTDLIGNEFAQTIIGALAPGNIDGGLGADVMAGLGGNDTYQVRDAGDIVFESAGDGGDTVFVHSGVSDYALWAGQEIERLYAFTIADTQALNLTGNELVNALRGSNGDNVLIGGAGNDVLEGLLGSDSYRVEDFGDTIVETVHGNNDIDGVYVAMNRSGYVLNEGAEVEVLAAIDPSSTIDFNLAGNAQFGNTLFGSAGRNVLIGGDGPIGDTLVGFAGNDVYRVENSVDKVIEGAGAGYDAVYASRSYTLTAGQEIEVLAVIAPTSTVAIDLTGNGAANELYGNAGANILDGKSGTDLLFGFAGADTFAFTVSADQGDIDTIGDFLAGTDKIGLDDSTFAGIGTPGAFNANAFRVGTVAADADDRIIYDQATGRLFYDSDGSGSGAAYHFATLTGTPVLAASDFAVI